jgi:hypothetical protein
MSAGASDSASDATVEYVSNDVASDGASDVDQMESYYLAGGSGMGTSIGPTGTMNLAIFIVSAMVATVVGAVMVAVWVRSILPGCLRLCSFAISFLIPLMLSHFGLCLFPPLCVAHE